MEGVKGSSYKIKNRSNVAYKLIKTDLDKLEGVYTDNETINLTYGYAQQGVAVESVQFVRDEIHSLTKKEVRLTYFIEPINAENKDVTFEVVSGEARILRGTTVISMIQGESIIKATSVSDPTKTATMKFIAQGNAVPLENVEIYNEYMIRNEWNPVFVKFTPEDTTDNMFIISNNQAGVEFRNRNGRYEFKVTSAIKAFECSIDVGLKSYPQKPIPVVDEIPKEEE